MTLTGRDAASGASIEVRADETISLVDTLIRDTEPDVFLAPGFIDLQVNGFAGVDYNSPHTSHDEIARSLEVQFATGVTRLFPTVITGSSGDMTGALRNLAAAKRTVPHGSAMEAFHVEGPYISPDDGPRGAHLRQHVRPPDLDEFRRFQDAAEGNIRLTTVSPEWPEAPAFIESLVRDGVVVSIGHTKASAEQIEAAVNAGATMSTHLGNGAHSVLPRHPNYLWDQLAEDRLTACFIVDGIHLPRQFLIVGLRAKGVERSVLVTDAVMPAGCPPGPYRLGELDVELHPDHRVTLAGQARLAGSSLRMDHGVENLMRFANLTLAQAVTMATKNPARIGRLSGRQRGLTPGERADVVKFRHDRNSGRIEVLETYLAGQRVH